MLYKTFFRISVIFLIIVISPVCRGSNQLSYPCHIHYIAQFKDKIPNDIVWPQADKFMDAIFSCSRIEGEAGNRCVYDYMHSHGASKNAILFTKIIGGPVKEIKQYGPVQIALVEEYAASNADTYYLLSSDGKVINTACQDFNLKPNPTYQAIIKKHPDASFGNWQNRISFKKVNRLPNKDYEFLFSYDFTDCHACATLSKINIAYIFDKGGIFKYTILQNINTLPATVDS